MDHVQLLWNEIVIDLCGLPAEACMFCQPGAENGAIKPSTRNITESTRSNTESVQSNTESAQSNTESVRSNTELKTIVIKGLVALHT
jgi:hypothetical protein